MVSATYVVLRAWEPLPIVGEPAQGIALRCLSFVWWVALAFTANVILRTRVWNSLSSRPHCPLIPEVFRDIGSAMVFFGATSGLLHFVFDFNVATITVT